MLFSTNPGRSRFQNINCLATYLLFQLSKQYMPGIGGEAKANSCCTYWCREIQNTDDSPLFRYETFINFLTLVFNMRRASYNFYYADCTIWPNKRAVHPVAPPPSWTGPAQSWISTNSFSKSESSQPIASGYDVIHTPVLFPIWGFYYDVYDCHILCSRVWTVLYVCAPALRAE